MSALTSQSKEFIRALIDELEVPDERYAQAERSYNAFGEWTQREESSVRRYSPEVYVQGSFRLGTAIKPANDQDDYDIDLVCVLKKLSKSDLSQKKLKDLMKVEVQSYKNANGIKKPIEESRRCWTLVYTDGAQFHMDVLPALPNAEGQRLLLEKGNFDASFVETAIAITDVDEAAYEVITDEWPRSNPKGYSEWFKSKMAEAFERIRKELAEAQTRKGAKASVEDIPEYRVRTPLQQAVMILKRHRDDMFEDNPDVKPISIIITTLAAHAYEGETEVGDALLGILERMDQFIHFQGEQCIIANPVDGTENFADRWTEHPERQGAFVNWLDQARSDFSELAKLTNYEAMAESNTTRIASDLRKRALGRVHQASGASLLGVASTAPAVAKNEYSFSNEPRKPQSPREFA